MVSPRARRSGNDGAVFLFSYGTLRFESVQRATFGRVLNSAPDAILGYRLETVEISDPAVLDSSGERFHPIIKPTGNSSDEVEGMVFEITGDEPIAADAYEVADYKSRSAVEIRPEPLGLCCRLKRS